MEKGSRKLQDGRESALILLTGYIVGAWLQVEFQLFAIFAAGVTGKTWLFNWGNRKEYDAEIESAKAKKENKLKEG